MSNDLKKSSTKERCPNCFGDRLTRVQGDPPWMRHCEGCGYDWDQSEDAHVMREALARRRFPKLGVTLNEGMPDSMTPSSTEAAPVVACPACGSTNMEVIDTLVPPRLRCLPCGHNWCELDRKMIDKFGYAVGMSLVEVAREQREARKESDVRTREQFLEVEARLKEATEPQCPWCGTEGDVRKNLDVPGVSLCLKCHRAWHPADIEVPRFPNSITGVDPGFSADQVVTIHHFPVRVDDGGAFVPDLEGEARRKNADELLVNAMRRLEEANARIERLEEELRARDAAYDANIHPECRVEVQHAYAPVDQSKPMVAAYVKPEATPE